MSLSKQTNLKPHADAVLEKCGNQANPGDVRQKMFGMAKDLKIERSKSTIVRAIKMVMKLTSSATSSALLKSSRC